MATKEDKTTAKAKTAAKTKTAAKAKVATTAKPVAQAKKAAAAEPKATAKAKVNTTEVKVTLLKSTIGRLKSHRACVRGLGLRRIHHTVTVVDTAENRGMINKVSYMLLVEEV